MQETSPLVPVEQPKTPQRWRWLLWLVAAFVAGGAAAGGFLYWRSLNNHTFSAGLVDPVETAPDFTLTDQTGQPFTLSQLKGKWILLNYGYTSCPDVCPATLAVLGRVQDELGENAAKVQLVFVTVDPERDTSTKVGEYVNHFGEGTIALTGTPEEIAAAAAPYGVRYARVDMPESALGYAMNHTAFVYLITPDFEWTMVFPFGVTPDEMRADLEFLMRQEARE